MSSRIRKWPLLIMHWGKWTKLTSVHKWRWKCMDALNACENAFKPVMSIKKYCKCHIEYGITRSHAKLSVLNFRLYLTNLQIF